MAASDAKTVTPSPPPAILRPTRGRDCPCRLRRGSDLGLPPGPGNLLTEINSTASATVNVVYHYLPQSDACSRGRYTIVADLRSLDDYLQGSNSRWCRCSPRAPVNTIPVTLADGDLTDSTILVSFRPALVGSASHHALTSTTRLSARSTSTPTTTACAIPASSGSRRST